MFTSERKHQSTVLKKTINKTMQIFCARHSYRTYSTECFFFTVNSLWILTKKVRFLLMQNLQRSHIYKSVNKKPTLLCLDQCTLDAIRWKNYVFTVFILSLYVLSFFICRVKNIWSKNHKGHLDHIHSQQAKYIFKTSYLYKSTVIMGATI